MIDLRDNIRIVLLVALCILATLALFGPLGAGDGDVAEAVEDEQTFSDPTNLQYGLELSGGARVRGLLVGQTAEGIPFDRDQASLIEGDVAEELGVDPIDVRARADDETVELYVPQEEISRSQFASALNSAGLDATEDDIRDGTTAATRDSATDILENRIDDTGLSGASVSTVSSATGGTFIIVEAPGQDRQSLEDLIGRPGRVQIMAGYPDPNNDTAPQMEEVLTEEDFRSDAQARAPEADAGPRVAVSLTDDGAENFAERMIDTGFTRDGRGNCDFDPDTDEPSPNQHCLYTVLDGEIVHGAAMGDLADSLDPGGTGDYSEWIAGGASFTINTGNFDEARQLAIDLQSGSLPTEFSIESSNFISPSLAQAFKPLALLTALAAWGAVSLVVYFWYRDVRVAIPMLVTASTEVYLLLGFAAGVGLALDLSHIAGLIAVIGTGLDDLIIMADEILQRKKEVKTGRIFQSRFRKAFWIILMAAGTTIVAMSPLAVLSLGDLQGFAIVTIVGVLIGVFITRPAYGDILRHLMLDDVKRKD